MNLRFFGSFQNVLPSSFLGVASVAVLGCFLVAQPASARRSALRSSRHAAAPKLLAAALPEPGEIASADEELPAEGPKYSLNLANLHTGESLNITYRIGNTYLPDALDKLNLFLRDSHNGDVSEYDPREFDVLHTVLARLGKKEGTIDIVCGYRSSETNEMLRAGSTARTGVAEHSQHVLAKAIDIRVPGVSTQLLRDAALSVDAGGVGYYPKSQFVHVDVGPVRKWTFAPGVAHRGKRSTHRKRA